MKFGGSSVADPDKIRHVARRLVEAHERGARVVGTISAMGKTTDALLELAQQVSPHPAPARARHAPLDRRADRVRARRDGRPRPRAGGRVVHRLAGGDPHGLGPHAREDPADHAGAHPRGARRGEDRPRRGVPGLLARHDGHHDARPRRRRPDRGRARGRARRVVRDLLRRPRRLHRRPAHRPGRAQARRPSRTRRCSRWPRPARGCSRCARSSSRAGTACRSTRARPSPRSREPGSQDVAGMEAPIVSAVTHSEDEVLFTLRGVPDVPGTAAAIFEAVAGEHVSVDTILQNAVHGSAELSFSVPLEDVSGTRRALATAQESIGPIEIEEISDLGKVSLVGAGMRSHPGVAAHMFRDARGRVDQPAADLDVADQDLLPRLARRGRARGPRAPRGLPRRASGRRRDRAPRRRSRRHAPRRARTRRRHATRSSSSPALLLFLSTFAVWVDRVALNTERLRGHELRADRGRGDPARRRDEGGRRALRLRRRREGARGAAARGRRVARGADRRPALRHVAPGIVERALAAAAAAAPLAACARARRTRRSSPCSRSGAARSRPRKASSRSTSATSCVEAADRIGISDSVRGTDRRGRRAHRDPPLGRARHRAGRVPAPEHGRVGAAAAHARRSSGWRSGSPATGAG